MKKEKYEFINVRVPADMKKALNKKAVKEHRGLSSYLRLLFLKVIRK